MSKYIPREQMAIILDNTIGMYCSGGQRKLLPGARNRMLFAMQGQRLTAYKFAELVMNLLTDEIVTYFHAPCLFRPFWPEGNTWWAPDWNSNRRSWI